ncbi:CD209 antigen-like protein E [Clarias gariepinus]|uniref:CD209 antigen-like protein E n=1 Tax=Clarias gariepinus TaxID=13013 RepID=UPI00234D92A9|nr:CD209 antigen-like protein E [Clarias gariepinus]
MELSEEIYENVKVMENKKADFSDNENSYENVYENQDNWETQRPRNFKQSVSSGGATAWGRCYRGTAVCMLLLCVLLLTAITVLWIKYITLNTENNQLQTSFNNLTIERDQLQTSFNNLTIERDQLQTSFNNLTLEKCQKCFVVSSLYFMSNEVKNWTESRQDCRDKGADLVIINSKEEQEFISKQKVNGKVQAWIGLSDTEKEGEWKWVDGTPLTTEFWNEKEPNNIGDEDCTEFYSGANGNLWNDQKCSKKLNWICEKHLSQ